MVGEALGEALCRLSTARRPASVSADGRYQIGLTIFNIEILIITEPV